MMSAEQSLAIDAYHVGVVCALPHEMTAVRAMLDEEFEPLRSQDIRDHNSYVLGRMSRHNVVIAYLPAGVYGTTSAATVARDMLRTFLGLRFGLLVGIGGGVPKHEQYQQWHESIPLKWWSGCAVDLPSAALQG